MTFAEVLERATSRLGKPVKKTQYGLCDLRPAYGHIFQDLLNGYDFWGHADIDVVWGRLGLLLSEPHLERYDIISSRRGYIAGHLTAYRNCDHINSLFYNIEGFVEDLQRPD